jgi:hypothetical protein
VILLVGSGPTDRDWCSPLLPGSNGSGRLIAERLAENGFVTLRYDKAGSGVHAKENIQKFAGRVNMQYFADELHGAFEKLSGEDGVNMDLIFALTNSEGAIHAVNYQLGNFEKISGVSFLQVHMEDLLEMLPEASFCHSLENCQMQIQL